ncbi:TAXI family TRAP transporter solute-binding subunit [Nocardiopsis sediminis]|uniref:TAXI family TRAP transporter solute-binding subunit n=1 Tax=Nocardiopsis sediminis TaxID=1778267 RepID=A0ABV8FUJ2_9ACTN
MSGHPDVARRSVLVGGMAVLAGCGGRAVPDLPELVLATGPPGAVFREIGATLARLLDRALPDTRVVARETAASADNIRLLHDGAAQVGFSSLDAAVGASGRPPEGMGALGRLYDSFLHLVVPADSPLRSYGDLDRHRVSFGADGSGTEFIMTRLADLTGLDVRETLLDQADSADALTTGDLDAMFSLTGVPTPAVAQITAAGGARLIGLRGQADRLADAYPAPYIPATIPATAYEDVPATPTVAVPNILLARSDLPDEVARIITETVFTQSAAIAADRPEAAHINVRTGIATGPVPLHPGAERWFRDRKS